MTDTTCIKPPTSMAKLYTERQRYAAIALLSCFGFMAAIGILIPEVGQILRGKGTDTFSPDGLPNPHDYVEYFGKQVLNFYYGRFMLGLLGCVFTAGWAVKGGIKSLRTHYRILDRQV